MKLGFSQNDMLEKLDHGDVEKVAVPHDVDHWLLEEPACKGIGLQ